MAVEWLRSEYNLSLDFKIKSTGILLLEQFIDKSIKQLTNQLIWNLIFSLQLLNFGM
jgi:hypothetical protein